MNEQTPQQIASRVLDLVAKKAPWVSDYDKAKLIHDQSTELATLREENERLRAATTKPEINTHVRLFDLVRYLRSELHREGLITDEEYTWLCAGPMAMSPKGGSPSRQRLEDYDKIQSQLRDLRGKAETLAATVSVVVSIARVGWGDRDAGITTALDQAEKNLAAYRAAQGVDATPPSDSSR